MLASKLDRTCTQERGGYGAMEGAPPRSCAQLLRSADGKFRTQLYNVPALAMNFSIIDKGLTPSVDNQHAAV